MLIYIQAASELGINYSTAKTLLFLYRKTLKRPYGSVPNARNMGNWSDFEESSDLDSNSTCSKFGSEPHALMDMEKLLKNPGK
jgi:hypothetical protein